MSVVETKMEQVINDDAAANSACSCFIEPPVSLPTHNPESSASTLGPDDIAVQPTQQFPYVVGFTATATRHQPPEPFGLGYDTGCPLSLPLNNQKSLSKAEYCLSRHLCPSRSLEDVKTLTITAVIRTGHSRGAQLVVIDNDTVAKIYDPLYYNEVNEHGFEEDVMFDAFSDYSREAAAYNQLQESPAARQVTPAFYGTWTISVDTEIRDGGELQMRTRQVPLVLMEYVRGETMRNIDARALPEQIRYRILKKAIDTDIIIFHAGVDNEDFCPRNIMVVGLRPNPKDDTPDDVAIKAIDFNVATVRRHPKCYGADMVREIDEERKAWLPKLQSPMIRWFNGIETFAWDDWCPRGDGKPELWLWEQYRDDERYIPVIWDPSKPRVRPELVELESGSETSVDSGLGLDMEVEKGEEGGEKSSVDVEDHIASAMQVS